MEMLRNPHDEVREMCRSYMQRSGTSQNKLAAQLQISAGHLSALMSGKDDSKVSLEALGQIAQYLRPYANAAWQAVETTNYKRGQALCKDCQELGRMRMMTAEAGQGKTFLLQDYKMRNPNVFYVQCMDGDTRNDFLKDILQELGVKVPSKNATAGKMIRMIESALLMKYKPLLILDEASSLNGKKVQTVKDLYNRLSGHCGIVLAGVGYVYSNLVQDAASERDGVPELVSRIGHCEKLPKVKKDEKMAVARANGITNEGVVNWLVSTSADLRQLRDRMQDLVKFKLTDADPSKLAQIFAI